MILTIFGNFAPCSSERDFCLSVFGLCCVVYGLSLRLDSLYDLNNDLGKRWSDRGRF